jgi:uracil-DNA glycosylase family 4
MAGLFQLDDVMVLDPVPRVAQCGKCGLWQNCKSPKMEVAGNGQRKILVVGEAPGREEDARGTPFVGASGHLLQSILRRNGIDLFRDCWITNAARCRPADNKLPDKAVDHCRPYLLNAIQKYKPEIIILLGGSALDSLIGYLWGGAPGGIKMWAGFRIPCQRYNAWVCPTFHPMRTEYCKAEGDVVTLLKFKEHIESFSKLSGRPWKTVPKFEDQVEVILKDDEAVGAINDLDLDENGCIAFDFETTTTKPDGPKAEIWCCSISDGTSSFAYPWRGKAVQSTLNLLQNPEIGKYGWNDKFEERWVRRKYGCRVRGWTQDGMLIAHGHDSRRGITKLKFQAFVKLGQERWDSYVGPYLKADSGNAENRIRDADRTKVLRYCGTDSLIEAKIAQMQKKECKL